MINNLKHSERFIELLMDGKFIEPRIMNIWRLGTNTKEEKPLKQRIEEYNFFINSSIYEEI